MKQKDIRKAKKEINAAIAKMVKDYGCVLMAQRWDDDEFITECEKNGHRLYHSKDGIEFRLW